MTDYFALLEQPRQPWLDQDALKDRYQSLAKSRHPDQTDATPADQTFADLVEANRVLSDDKLRLHHLLQLEAFDASQGNAVPSRILHLFSEVGEFLTRSERLEHRFTEATNPLAKSLLQSELITCRNEVAGLIAHTRELVSQARDECRALNDSWRDQLPKVAKLYFLFAFLTKWLAQLEERQFRLENL